LYDNQKPSEEEKPTLHVNLEVYARELGVLYVGESVAE